MARKGRPPTSTNRKIKNRPIRTRDHIIANLSSLHIQWIAVNCGYVVEAPQNDYGYDLVLFTYTEGGEIENGSVLFQLKATDELAKYVMSDGKTISFAIERQHIDLWRDEPMPVILVVYDAKTEQAYWLYTQRYFETAAIALAYNQAKVSLHIPMTNIVDDKAIQTIRTLKEDVLLRIRKVSLHD